MSNRALSEADVELSAFYWLSCLGWAVTHGPNIAPESPNAEYDGYD